MLMPDRIYQQPKELPSQDRQHLCQKKNTLNQHRKYLKTQQCRDLFVCGAGTFGSIVEKIRPSLVLTKNAVPNIGISQGVGRKRHSKIGRKRNFLDF